MPVSAILVVNSQSGITSLSRKTGQEPSLTSKLSMSCVDILGQSVLERTLTRFWNAGIRTMSVIGGAEVYSLPPHKNIKVIHAENPFSRWPAAQRAVSYQRAQGIDAVIMVGLGAYLEPNVARAVKFHRAQGTPLTQLDDQDGTPLDFWIVDTNWFSTAATGCTLPFRYGEFPGLPVPCKMEGYINRLSEPRDLRQLVVDAFLGRCELRPRGTEVRPGIWMDDGARVHKRSRLVAPVYLGRSSRIDSSAVITRFSNVERGAHVGAGTVVDRASVLPHTVVGSGLDLSQAIVHGDKLLKVDRNVALQIDDPHLLRDNVPRGQLTPARDRQWQSGERQGVPEFQYLQLLSRAAGRFSEVFFKG